MNSSYTQKLFQLACVFCFLTHLPAQKTIETLSFDPEKMNVLIRQTAMPEMGDSRIEKILRRYYIEGLGGAENWEKIESLRVAGTLKLKGTDYELNAYQKKPDYIKMKIYGPQQDVTLGYDGKVAWQISSQVKEGAQPMDTEAARRFIHGAHFGNHLLYPYAKGKTVSYIDTVPVEGTICHQMRVVLDTGFQVDYFIDIRTYLEIKVTNLDLQNSRSSSVVYTDYIREFGMPIAKKVTSYENGEWVSDLTLEEVKVNSGIMPWMFKMPH